MNTKINDSLRKKIMRIKVFIIDNDGVLAKPFIIWSNNDLGGKRLFETKLFCVHDGSSCWVAKAAGLKLVLVSGRASESVYKRAQRIRIDDVYLDQINKIETLSKIIKKYKVLTEEVAYIGDDFLDIPIFEKCGFAITVNDAVDEAKQIAHYVTHKNGGEGAVAEAIRLILKVQNKWDKAMQKVINDTYKLSSNHNKLK